MTGPNLSQISQSPSNTKCFLLHAIVVQFKFESIYDAQDSTSNVLGVTSEVLDATSKVVDVSPKVVDVPPEVLEVTSKVVDVTSKGLDVAPAGAVVTSKDTVIASFVETGLRRISEARAFVRC